MNLKILEKSIKEHTPIHIEYLSKTKIRIGTTICEINSNVLKSKNIALRFPNLKHLLIELRNCGILEIKKQETINSIANRYKKLDHGNIQKA